MTSLKSAWSFLQGKKTYIVAGLMILLGFLQGNHDLIWQGLGFAGLRNALP